MLCFFLGHKWQMINSFCHAHLWGCRRCQKVKIQIFGCHQLPYPAARHRRTRG